MADIKLKPIKPTYHITTFGCQMNEHDSETLAGMLEELGYMKSENKKEADVAIINTCSVRDNADKRFFGTLGQLKRSRKTRQNMVVAVCGCMMQQQHIVDMVKEKYPWVDLVFGTHNIHEFPRLLANVRLEKKKIVAVWQEGGEVAEGLPVKRELPFKALVDVMYGCNNFCTYCIVPYTRGRERSRNPRDILAEARALAADGVKEIMLLGQNVNSYDGRVTVEGREERADFADLIGALNEIQGVERIRFMTSHPKDLSNKLIAAFRDCDKLCNGIHLPVQSGSSRILRKMNRNYSKEDYLNLVDQLKQAVPEIAITTDIIVGFPGETEEDFAETLDLVEKVRFDAAFTFLYSVRKGTPAEKFADQVPEAVKHERFNRLVECLNEIMAQKNKEREGAVETILVEGKSKTDACALTGRTESGKIVNFKGDDGLIGHMLEVKITAGKTFSLFAEIVGTVASST